MKPDHEHVWAVSRWHAGIGCAIYGCDAPYLDYAQDQIRQQAQTITALLSVVALQVVEIDSWAQKYRGSWKRSGRHISLHPSRCECDACNEMFGPMAAKKNPPDLTAGERGQIEGEGSTER